MPTPNEDQDIYQAYDDAERCSCSHIRDSHATVPGVTYCLIGTCPCMAWEMRAE